MVLLDGVIYTKPKKIHIVGCMNTKRLLMKAKTMFLIKFEKYKKEH